MSGCCIPELPLCKPQLWRESARAHNRVYFSQAGSRDLSDNIHHKVFHYLSLSSGSGLDVGPAAWGRGERTVLHGWPNEQGRPE